MEGREEVEGEGGGEREGAEEERLLFLSRSAS